MPRKKNSSFTTLFPDSPGNKTPPSFSPLVSKKLQDWCDQKLMPAGGDSMSHDLLRVRYQSLLRRHGYGRTKAQSFLKRLGRTGIDSESVLSILKGHSHPYHDVFDLHFQWCIADCADANNQERHRAVIRLKGDLRKLQKAEMFIRSSPLVSTLLKTIVERELRAIETALDLLILDTPGDQTRPSEPFTVTLVDRRNRRKGNEESQWSRHSFWTPVITALRSIWQKAGKTDYQAFMDIAHLLALSFPPFPDKATFVKNRFYNAARQLPPSD